MNFKKQLKLIKWKGKMVSLGALGTGAAVLAISINDSNHTSSLSDQNLNSADVSSGEKYSSNTYSSETTFLGMSPLQLIGGQWVNYDQYEWNMAHASAVHLSKTINSFLLNIQNNTLEAGFNKPSDNNLTMFEAYDRDHVANVSNIVSKLKNVTNNFPSQFLENNEKFNVQTLFLKYFKEAYPGLDKLLNLYVPDDFSASNQWSFIHQRAEFAGKYENSNPSWSDPMLVNRTDEHNNRWDFDFTPKSSYYDNYVVGLSNDPFFNKLELTNAVANDMDGSLTLTYNWHFERFSTNLSFRVGNFLKISNAPLNPSNLFTMDESFPKYLSKELFGEFGTSSIGAIASELEMTDDELKKMLIDYLVSDEYKKHILGNTQISQNFLGGEWSQEIVFATPGNNRSFIEEQVNNYVTLKLELDNIDGKAKLLITFIKDDYASEYVSDNGEFNFEGILNDHTSSLDIKRVEENVLWTTEYNDIFEQEGLDQIFGADFTGDYEKYFNGIKSFSPDWRNFININFSLRKETLLSGLSENINKSLKPSQVNKSDLSSFLYQEEWMENIFTEPGKDRESAQEAFKHRDEWNFHFENVDDKNGTMDIVYYDFDSIDLPGQTYSASNVTQHITGLYTTWQEELDNLFSDIQKPEGNEFVGSDFFKAMSEGILESTLPSNVSNEDISHYIIDKIGSNLLPETLKNKDEWRFTSDHNDSDTILYITFQSYANEDRKDNFVASTDIELWQRYLDYFMTNNFPYINNIFKELKTKTRLASEITANEIKIKILDAIKNEHTNVGLDSSNSDGRSQEEIKYILGIWEWIENIKTNKLDQINLNVSANDWLGSLSVNYKSFQSIVPNNGGEEIIDKITFSDNDITVSKHVVRKIGQNNLSSKSNTISKGDYASSERSIFKNQSITMEMANDSFWTTQEKSFDTIFAANSNYGYLFEDIQVPYLKDTTWYIENKWAISQKLKELTSFVLSDPQKLFSENAVINQFIIKKSDSLFNKVTNVVDEVNMDSFKFTINPTNPTLSSRDIDFHGKLLSWQKREDEIMSFQEFRDDPTFLDGFKEFDVLPSDISEEQLLSCFLPTAFSMRFSNYNVKNYFDEYVKSMNYLGLQTQIDANISLPTMLTSHNKVPLPEDAFKIVSRNNDLGQIKIKYYVIEDNVDPNTQSLVTGEPQSYLITLDGFFTTWQKDFNEIFSDDSINSLPDDFFDGLASKFNVPSQWSYFDTISSYLKMNYGNTEFKNDQGSFSLTSSMIDNVDNVNLSFVADDVEGTLTIRYTSFRTNQVREFFVSDFCNLYDIALDDFFAPRGKQSLDFIKNLFNDLSVANANSLPSEIVFDDIVEFIKQNYPYDNFDDWYSSIGGDDYLDNWQMVLEAHDLDGELKIKYVPITRYDLQRMEDYSDKSPSNTASINGDIYDDDYGFTYTIKGFNSSWQKELSNIFSQQPEFLSEASVSTTFFENMGTMGTNRKQAGSVNSTELFEYIKSNYGFQNDDLLLSDNVISKIDQWPFTISGDDELGELTVSFTNYLNQTSEYKVSGYLKNWEREMDNNFGKNGLINDGFFAKISSENIKASSILKSDVIDYMKAQYANVKNEQLSNDALINFENWKISINNNDAEGKLTITYTNFSDGITTRDFVINNFLNDQQDDDKNKLSLILDLFTDTFEATGKSNLLPTEIDPNWSDMTDYGIVITGDDAISNISPKVTITCEYIDNSATNVFGQARIKIIASLGIFTQEKILTVSGYETQLEREYNDLKSFISNINYDIDLKAQIQALQKQSSEIVDVDVYKIINDYLNVSVIGLQSNAITARHLELFTQDSISISNIDNEDGSFLITISLADETSKDERIKSIENITITATSNSCITNNQLAVQKMIDGITVDQIIEGLLKINTIDSDGTTQPKYSHAQPSQVLKEEIINIIKEQESFKSLTDDQKSLINFDSSSSNFDVKLTPDNQDGTLTINVRFFSYSKNIKVINELFITNNDLENMSAIMDILNEYINLPEKITTNLSPLVLPSEIILNGSDDNSILGIPEIEETKLSNVDSISYSLVDGGWDDENGTLELNVEVAKSPTTISTTFIVYGYKTTLMQNKEEVDSLISGLTKDDISSIINLNKKASHITVEDIKEQIKSVIDYEGLEDAQKIIFDKNIYISFTPNDDEGSLVLNVVKTNGEKIVFNFEANSLLTTAQYSVLISVIGATWEEMNLSTESSQILLPSNVAKSIIENGLASSGMWGDFNFNDIVTNITQVGDDEAGVLTISFELFGANHIEKSSSNIYSTNEKTDNMTNLADIVAKFIDVQTTLDNAIDIVPSSINMETLSSPSDFEQNLGFTKPLGIIGDANIEYLQITNNDNDGIITINLRITLGDEVAYGDFNVTGFRSNNEVERREISDIMDSIEITYIKSELSGKMPSQVVITELHRIITKAVMQANPNVDLSEFATTDIFISEDLDDSTGKFIFGIQNWCETKSYELIDGSLITSDQLALNDFFNDLEWSDISSEIDSNSLASDIVSADIFKVVTDLASSALTPSQFGLIELSQFRLKSDNEGGKLSIYISHVFTTLEISVFDSGFSYFTKTEVNTWNDLVNRMDQFSQIIVTTKTGDFPSDLGESNYLSITEFNEKYGTNFNLGFVDYWINVSINVEKAGISDIDGSIYFEVIATSELEDNISHSIKVNATGFKSNNSSNKFSEIQKSQLQLVYSSIIEEYNKLSNAIDLNDSYLSNFININKLYPPIFEMDRNTNEIVDNVLTREYVSNVVDTLIQIDYKMLVQQEVWNSNNKVRGEIVQGYMNGIVNGEINDESQLYSLLFKEPLTKGTSLKDLSVQKDIHNRVEMFLNEVKNYTIKLLDTIIGDISSTNDSYNKEEIIIKLDEFYGFQQLVNNVPSINTIVLTPWIEEKINFVINEEENNRHDSALPIVMRLAPIMGSNSNFDEDFSLERWGQYISNNMMSQSTSKVQNMENIRRFDFGSSESYDSNFSLSTNDNLSENNEKIKNAIGHSTTMFGPISLNMQFDQHGKIIYSRILNVLSNNYEKLSSLSIKNIFFSSGSNILSEYIIKFELEENWVVYIKNNPKDNTIIYQLAHNNRLVEVDSYKLDADENTDKKQVWAWEQISIDGEKVSEFSRNRFISTDINALMQGTQNSSELSEGVELDQGYHSLNHNSSYVDYQDTNDSKYTKFSISKNEVFENGKMRYELEVIPRIGNHDSSDWKWTINISNDGVGYHLENKVQEKLVIDDVAKSNTLLIALSSAGSALLIAMTLGLFFILRKRKQNKLLNEYNMKKRMKNSQK